MFKGPRLKSRSLIKSFLSKNAAIKNPINTFIGAGAMAIEKGNKITHQYNNPFKVSLEGMALPRTFKSRTNHAQNNLKGVIISYLLALRVTARMVSDRDFLNS